MASALHRLGRWCVRHRRTVLVAWVLTAVALFVGGRAAGGELQDDYSVPGVESQTAIDVLKEQFPEYAGTSALVIVHSRDGDLTQPRHRAAVERLTDRIDDFSSVSGVSDPFAPGGALAPDRTIALIEVQYEDDVQGVGVEAYDDLRASGDVARDAGLQVEFGGELPFFAEDQRPAASEAIGLLAALVILLLAFGSVIAVGLPIGTALIGLATGGAAVVLASAFLSVPTVSTTMASMIGLGVGIDYALFVITRHRQGLHRGLTVEDAGGRAIATAGQAVLFAGGTVVIAILGLAVAGIAVVTMMGVAAALVVAIMAVASVTLLPALLGFAGHNIDKLRVPGIHPEVEEGRNRRGELGGWARWGRRVAHRPLPYLIIGLVVVLALTAPAFAMRLGMADAGTEPESSTLRRGYDLVSEAFGRGANGPLILTVDLTGVPGGRDGWERALAGVQRAVGEDPGVAIAAPPIVNDEGDTAILRVIPTSAPQEQATTDLVERLRADVLPGATAEGPAEGAEIHVGGVTATFVDVSSRIGERLPWFIAAVVGLSFLLLMCVFRSVLVPLKAALMNLLSIGAAYGVVVAIFQWGWGASLVGLEETVPIVSFIPMFMFAILFGLSMDYEVFLLSRVREDYLEHGDNTASVVNGIAATARVITSAALIMISVVLAFALDPDPTVKMMGVGLATAVFVDATIIRVVLVPATMRLLGDANWWLPSWLDRVLPRLDIEGEQGLPAPEYEDGPPPAEDERLSRDREPVAV